MASKYGRFEGIGIGLKNVEDPLFSNQMENMLKEKLLLSIRGSNFELWLSGDERFWQFERNNQ